jgi:small-conductance mechanosensitive channel
VIGALGVGIGFGLQTIVNNFVSGLILIFERPIKVGDAIETPDYFGRVRRIGIRASVIRSYDGAEIVVPNGELISKAVTNWTGTDENRRLDIPIGVAYGTDPEQVLEILRGVARAHPRVADVPPPDAQMIRFGDSSLDFQLRAWCVMEHRVDVASDLHVAINRELAAAGISIPFPQRDLHIKPEGAAPIANPLEQTE